MRLTVTLIAGAYRATDREILNRVPYREQPGDLIVQVSAELEKPVSLAGAQHTLVMMFQEAERSLDRQLAPIVIPVKEAQ